MQVNLILNAKEFNKEFNDTTVKSYDSNQVASNNPLEDRRSEASCLYTNGEKIISISNWAVFILFVLLQSNFRFTVWCF